MQKLIILAAVAACCLAAPSLPSLDSNDARSHVTSLQRPSPINPEVPSDPKPAEKITMITDPKEIAKHKRETGHQAVAATLLLPTAHPTNSDGHHQTHEAATNHQVDAETNGDHHHREKREHKTPPAVEENKSDVKPVSKPIVTPAPSSVLSSPKKTSTPAPLQTQSTTKPTKRTRRRKTSTTKAPAPAPAKQDVKVAAPTPVKKDTPVPAPAPAKKDTPVVSPPAHRQKREEHSAVSIPLIYKDENKKPFDGVSHVVPQEILQAGQSVSHLQQQQQQQPQTTQYISPQTLPAYTPTNEHHDDSNGFIKPQTLPAYIPDQHHTDGGFVKPQTLPGQLPVGEAEVEPQTLPALNHGLPAVSYSSAPSAHIEKKRDIPVPLVAKHQHPEESPKEEDEKKDEHEHKEEKKEEHQSTDEGKIEHSKNNAHVEDLTAEVPAHHPHQPQHDFHPHTHIEHRHQQSQQHPQADSGVSTSSTTTTTELPVIRHHPVPVAELFSRPRHEEPTN